MLKSLLINKNGKTYLPEETEEGNVEYKLELDSFGPHSSEKNKIIKMTSQMLWRLNEGKILKGKYEAHYLLGVMDDGTIGNISLDKINKSISVIHEVCNRCEAEIVTIDIQQIHSGYVADICIRKRIDGGTIHESRVGLLGSSNHGKTTCISLMTYEQKDNGNGCGRSIIFRHSHEQSSGITSSIKQEIIGFKNNNIINYKTSLFSSWEKIIKNSDKIITFIDLPGCSKYIRTTIFGLLAHKPDIIMIVISAFDCYKDDEIILPSDTLLHINLSINLDIPFCFLLTKSDLVTKEIMQKLIDKISIYSRPYFIISNINGENYDAVYKYLNMLEPRKIHDKRLENNNVEFMINDTYEISEIGTVVSGILLNGVIKVNESYLIGPVNNNYYPVEIKSIHRKQMDCKSIFPTESASLEIGVDTNNKILIDKHLMIINENMKSNVIAYLYMCISKTDALKLKLDHPYTIYIGNIIESVCILEIIERDKHNWIKLIFSRNFPKIEQIHSPKPDLLTYKYVKNGDYGIIRDNAPSDNFIIGKCWHEMDGCSKDVID
ncbi:MAG: GTPase [Edafosvirus sp.]|uniref:GTPase n=1 Tax=Edafosvirus sp. TaxID=2487765 RepID=A0A3G4ZTK5_9VIRU|nr:MAG: GTPase [Edafosvirus sp.]